MIIIRDTQYLNWLFLIARAIKDFLYRKKKKTNRQKSRIDFLITKIRAQRKLINNLFKLCSEKLYFRIVCFRIFRTEEIQLIYLNSILVPRPVHMNGTPS